VRCSALQCLAATTHCNTLQHTTAHCSILQHENTCIEGSTSRVDACVRTTHNTHLHLCESDRADSNRIECIE